jgi:3alpha(or 20beta)-hydroxysteroid dehydrogenase
MTRSAAQDLAKHGIRVNSVHPGPIDTPMIAGTQPRAPDGSNPRVPMRREGRPEEVARLTLFLLSDESSFSTGSEFLIDGGMHA